MNGARDTRRFPLFTLVEAARAQPPAANDGFARGSDESTAVGLGPAIPRLPSNENRRTDEVEAAPRSTLLPAPPRPRVRRPLPDLTFDDRPDAPLSVHQHTPPRTKDEGARLSHLPLADLVNHFARIARAREREHEHDA